MQFVPAPDHSRRAGTGSLRAASGGSTSRDVETVQSEPMRSWDTAAEDTQSRRPWLIVVVMLVLRRACDMAPGTACRAPRRPLESAAAQPRSPPLSGAEAQVSPTPRRRAGAIGNAVRRSARRRTSFRRHLSSGTRWLLAVRPPRAAATPPVARAEPVPVAGLPLRRTGRMLIRSSPSGEVRVNGVLRGETPVVLRDLPFGSLFDCRHAPRLRADRARVDAARVTAGGVAERGSRAPGCRRSGNGCR